MSVSEDLINFDIIEDQKENIQALPQGRSAKALISAFASSPFSPLPTTGVTRNLNDAIRAEYEAELQTIDDSDDPLDIYDRYVKWTFNSYPTAQATPESQLRPLLERATKAFQSTPTYKNDPRYLKLWIHYIRLFSDAPREIFAYLSRHGIGDGLALYYEEFATWLEGAGRWNQAEEIYKLGIEREARPSERLLRKFGEFQKRNEARSENIEEPSSPALPTVRPALAAKIDPYATSTTRPEDPQAQRLPSTSITNKIGRQKMAIFSDADGSLAGKSETNEASKGWDNIGSIKDRKKENVMEAKPWAGETLKVGKRVCTVPKMTVFRDQSASGVNESSESMNSKTFGTLVSLQETENIKTGRQERIDVNLSRIYPNDMDEFCFEEAIAGHRGWMAKDWSLNKGLKSAPISDAISGFQEPKLISCQVDGRRNASEPDLGAESISHDQRLSDVTQELSKDETISRPKRKKTMEVKGETQTVKLNMASPPAVKKLRRRSMAEPTMTLHSRAATDEVLDMFNQTLQNVDSINEESHNPDDSYYEDDDYTSGGESTCTGTGRLSGTTSNCDEETEALDKTTQSLKEEITEPDSASPWSELSTDKHVPGLSEIHTSDSIGLVNEEFKTPNSQENRHKSGAQFMPSPPEGFEPPTHPYRDPEQTNQNRLPFMTPIVEITESSLSMPSSRLPVDYFTHKTPSRRRHDGDPSIPELEDLILDEDTTYYQKLSRVEEEVPEAQLPAFGDSSSTPTQTTRSHIEDLSLIEPIILLESESSERKRHDPEAAAPSSELGQLSLLDLSARLVMDTKSISVIREAIGRPDRDVVIFDDHINPVDDDMRQRIIQSLEPSITTYPGYYNHNPVSSQIKSDLERLTKTGAKKPKNGNEKSNNNGNEVILTTSIDEVFTVKQLLGRGGWATVFLAEKTSNNEEIELQAMKSEFDPSAWEYSLMVLAQARLAYYPQQESRRSIVSVATPLSYHSYSDAGYMFESFHDQGNLLELVNKIKADALPGGLTSGAVTPGVDEQIAMFFAIEILRTVSNMHLIGILHCDIKADNFLVRLDSIDESLDEWSSVYSASGAQGWSFKGIVLIDFGRAIDTLAFKPDTCFYAEWATDKHDCPEQREARPWTYHTDLWGIASIISVLLFGKVLEETVIAEPSSSLSSITSTSNLPLNNGSTTNSKRYKLRDPLKRYWQTELWSDAFDVLMNPAQHASQSERVGRGTGGIKGLPAMKLSSVRERMEAFLEENAEKKGLKQSLKKLEDKLNASSYNATRRR